MRRAETKTMPKREQLNTVNHFNLDQLATWDEAKALMLRINGSGEFQSVGIEIPAVTDDPATSGIFIPSWVGGPGGFPEPSDEPTSAFFLHYRFSNRMEGMNVGLVRGAFARYPNSPDYVLSELLREVQQGARTA